MARIRNGLALACLVAATTLALPTAVLALQSADQQQVKLAKGTWWGKVGDVVEIELKDKLGLPLKKSGTVTKIDADKGIITIEGIFDGVKAARPFFASEIQSIKAGKVTDAPIVEKAAPTNADDKTKDDGPRLNSPNLPSPGNVGLRDEKVRGSKKVGEKELGISDRRATGKVDSEGYPLDEKGYRISPKPGVFVLPWKDMVGGQARAFEIKQLAAHADKWGPGQIIVLEIDSPGGLVTEIYRISDAIKELRKNHRLVAWIKKAISAGSATAVHCDEIYFKTVGSLGACMMIQGLNSSDEAGVRRFIRDIGEVVEAAGRPAIVFEAMVYAAPILTYTKDPVTGKTTFHNKITGDPTEVVLSDDKDNLVFTASTAVDSGFAQGIADTGDELAKLLGLPEWYEISDYGRKISGDWNRTYKACEEDVQRLAGQLNVRMPDQVEQIQRRIQIFEKIVQWHSRCRPCIELNGVDIDQLKRQLEELKKQLAEIRKAQQGNRRMS